MLGQLRHRQRTVLLRSARRKGRKARHEEVQTREGDEVNGNLAKVAVQLPWEAQASRHAADRCAHQVVQVIGGSRELQCAEADVVESFVVEQEALVRILDE